jgi:hypothetical protein
MMVVRKEAEGRTREEWGLFGEETRKLAAVYIPANHDATVVVEQATEHPDPMPAVMEVTYCTAQGLRPALTSFAWSPCDAVYNCRL